MSIRGRRRGGRPRTVRTPSSLPGLIAWGHAADAPNPTDGAAVIGLRDRISGTVYNQLLGTANAGPLYRPSGIGGRPVLEFPASGNTDSRTNYALRAADPITIPDAAVNGYTIWAIIQRVGTQGQNGITVGIDDAQSSGDRIAQLGWQATAPRVVGFTPTAGARGLAQGPVPANNIGIVIGVQRPNGGQVFTNGNVGSTTDTTAATVALPRRLCIGNALTTANTSYWYRGLIAEWGVYDRALFNADRAILNSYAQDTYGITVADYVAA